MPSRGETFPTVPQALLLVLALFMAEVLTGAALQDANGVLGLSPAQIAAIGSVLAHGGVFAAAMHFQRLTYARLFHDSETSAKATFWLVVPPVLLLVPALIRCMTSVLAWVEQILPLSAWEVRAFEHMSDGSMAAIIASCVLAPILEEMLFRGIVLRSFLRQLPRGQAIMGSAIIFGLAHMNVYQFLVGLVIGTVLGWLYERSRSLIPCIALHAAYNTGLTALEPSGVSDGASWLWAAPAALCGAWMLRRLLASPGLAPGVRHIDL